jgi:nicastrin
VIVVAAKMDSLALVHDFSFGAAERTGAIVLLSIAEALSNSPNPISSLPRAIIFSLFDAESYGLSGSKKFVEDLTTPFACRLVSEKSSVSCPIINATCSSPCKWTTDFTRINFNQIEAVIDLDSFGSIYSEGGSANYYLHVDALNTATESLLSKFTGSATAPEFSGSPAYPINIMTISDPSKRRLPPSSLMSFLAKKRELPGFVAADYVSEFSNPFYESELDDGRTWTNSHVSSICGIATHLARSIYGLAGNVERSAAPAAIQANCSLVNQWMDCLSRNISCALVQTILDEQYKCIFG